MYLLWESLEKLGKIKTQPHLYFRKKTDSIESGLEIGESRGGAVHVETVPIFYVRDDTLMLVMVVG